MRDGKPVPYKFTVNSLYTVGQYFASGRAKLAPTKNVDDLR